MSTIRPAAILSGLLLLAAAAAAFPFQDGGEDLARKERLARRYLERIGWRKAFVEETVEALRAQERERKVAPGFAARFRAVADFDALLEAVVRIHRDRLDAESLESALAEAGDSGKGRFAAGPSALLDDVESSRKRWFVEAKLATLRSLSEKPATEEERGVAPSPGEGEAPAVGSGGPAPAEEDGDGPGESPPGEATADPTMAEKRAVALLSSIAAAQRMFRNGRFVDADGDEQGEYATVMELTASVGVRAQRDEEKNGSGFSRKGPAISAPLLEGELGKIVDGEGILVREGYCFRVYLPGVEDRARFVFESGPPSSAAIVGKTSLVGIDTSESFWCAYAWPVKRGEGGTRTFFVNQEGRVLQSPNRRIRWEGKERPIRPDAAFTGLSMTAPAALGTVGRDGEVWKVAE